MEPAKRPSVDSLILGNTLRISKYTVNPTRKIPVVVLGGGISGLTAARVLQEQKREYLLLERCPTLGGLTRTVEVGEFCFDYTGHFLHLSRCASPEEIPYANLKNDDWEQITRRSCCLVGQKFITAPIQYNLAELPRDLFKQCASSYDSRPRLQENETATFRDYVVSGFGQALSDLFLIPQNEKTMAIPLDRLSKNAVRRFFPAPDEALVLEGMNIGQKSRASGYNSIFWYPKVGGIGRLVQGLRSGLTNCALNEDVTAVNLRNKTVSTRTHGTISWDMLFSSIPLKSFCQITHDDELVDASANLSHSTTISFNIGLRGPLRPEFEGIHWIYIPDRSIPFYRVGFYSNIGTGMCSPGYSAIYVEVGLPSEELDRTNIVGDLQPKVMRSLQELGWIDSREVACTVTHVMRHAYVHHTPERDRAVEAILKRLRENCAFPIGRYGLWDYTSMEDSMESARTAVLELD
jgi:protoporphyrinogen oxidase